MQASLKDSVHDDPERLARIEAIRVRVESERVHVEQDEARQAQAQRSAKKQARILKAKKTARRVAIPQLAHWLKVIDRVNAMARNPGWSIRAVK